MLELSLMIISFWLAYYLLLIRPRRASLKARFAAQTKAQVNDWVLLQSGLYAKIIKVSEARVLVACDGNENQQQLFNKSAIVKILEDQPELLA